MPRPLRIHVPGAMYHVTLRGNHQQNIFFTVADRERLNGLFSDVLTRFNARLHAYCYMTNHVHALIQVSDVPLGRLMLRIAGRYARETQVRLQTTGHLFEKRYYPILVDADQYLLELLRYLHLNPVRAGMAASPDAYPWSSHHAYLGKRDEPWVTTDFGLALFGPDRMRATRAYQRFIQDALDRGDTRSPLEDLNTSDRRFLADDTFAQRLLGTEWKPRSRKTLDDLVSEACIKFMVTVPLLVSPSRAPDLVAARAWVAQEAVNGRIASIAEVARRFNRDESSMRHALKVRA